VTSGIRLGTPAVTTRGMKEKEMGLIAGYIADAVANRYVEKKLLNIKKEVHKLTKRFPIYGKH
jgi:glycine hydroxymethyltransferase